MLNWLRSLYGDAISGIDYLKRWVLDIFQTIYSYLDNLVNAIWQDITYVYQYLQSLYNYVINTLDNFYNTFLNLVYQSIRDLQAWVTRLMNDIYLFADQIINWTQSLINSIYSWVGQQLANLANWAIANIWDPLYNAINGALNWIYKYGYYMFWLLTHPDQLALLLAKYILAAWYQLGRQYAGAIGRFLLYSMVRAGSEVGGILSDILASII